MSDNNEIPEFDIDDLNAIKYEPVAESEWVEQRVVFFCHDCDKIVKEERIGNTLKFKCSECKGDQVSYGTEKAINNYYRGSRSA